MEPKLIYADDVGVRNSDLYASAMAMEKSTAWKQSRIAIIVPSGRMFPSRVALALWNLAMPANNRIARLMPVGMEVGDAYSHAIDQVVKHPMLSDWEFVLTLEHDNVPPADGVLSLVKRMHDNPDFSAISGLYWVKGEGGSPQIWGDPKDPEVNFRPQIPKPGELIECCGIGMGFALWRTSMFKDERIERPLFQTVQTNTAGMTQDLSFWAKARKLGYRCAVDCNVKVGHYDHERDIVW